MRWPLRNRPTAPEATGRGSDGELFDEAFQKRLEYLALVSRRIFSGQSRAERRSRRSGTGVEFADYRRYSPGDDIRQIDWNVYGRFDRLVLRQYEEEEDLSVYILLDCSASMGLGTPNKLAYGKKLAAALAYVALHHLDRVSITALRDSGVERLPPTRGQQRIFTVFDFLRPLAATGQTKLADAVATFVAQNKRRGVAILISDLYDPQGFEHCINALRYARFETHVLHLRSVADAEPAIRGDVELIDVETGESRRVTVTDKLLQRYRQRYQDRLEGIESFCVRKQVGYHGIDTATALEENVLRLLRRGGLVT
ncbi:MAG: DUF58 domain-containing protein [Myxococcales bacterium]|nr:DUF58 domain-containing protein [Myxococcales bacterium]